ncbi:Aste57867_13653 [Aphanomyces stellatus]|uniref:Aste57867_13653 protein n=1 Tax=Aphanomyces stellatus TaxID=120398 RepID=A0A485L0E3_9STRA|nr:hypothetical protein As57867_013603 [Aphanomyces stellatus]VFT90488.1 Aste57867_13653 [Aphanomyces stellatus]
MATQPSSFDAIRRKCLDAAWVANVSTTLGIDPNARDSQGRRLYPWLRVALPSPRFTINDPRHGLASAFQRSSFTASESLHGVGETVFTATGAQASQGTFQGTLTLEWNGWPSHSLMTSVIGILVQEALGYDVTFFDTPGALDASQRMSSVGKGTITPTHLNCEIWAAAKLAVLSIYNNETTAGSNGYVGQAGWFTLTANVNQANLGPAATSGTFARPFSSDFWREYLVGHDLVNFYSIQQASLARVASSTFCSDGTMGCLNGCSRSAACTTALANGQQCMIVAMMEPGYDPGYLQAAISNNNIPAYFCFAGYTGMQNAVIDAMTRNKSITFYHFEPDLFHLQYDGYLTRIALPRALPALVAMASGTFGENGYGTVTTNPVSVDFPQESLKKYYANLLNSDTFLSDFINKFQLTQLDINGMLAALVSLNNNSPTVANKPFAAACAWVKTNYATWKAWIDPLPLCTIGAHMQYATAGCNGTNSYRNITFAWNVPDPIHPALPYQCEGGTTTLPPPFLTSRSCDWLSANPDQWMAWIAAQPLCDMTFYNYTISPCDATAKRSVVFGWLLPQPANPAASLECIGGVTLPPNTTVVCDYVPTNSGTYSGMTAFAVIVMLLLVACAGAVVVFRGRPVIKRAQWPLLLMIILGGIFFCVYVIVGAGAPTDALCAGRPVTVVLGFSLVFGTLLVKGLRVYWIFANKQMKKVTVSLFQTFRMLGLVVAVDALILVVWMAVDFPGPSTSLTKATEFVGQVDHISCHSSSFIFSALLIFWKAIITFGGIYVSYSIRHVSSDFQESIWIFAASCVVLVGSIILLALAYLVNLPASITYTFSSIIILFCTLIVMGLMLGPKFVRLNAEDQKTTETTTDKGDATGQKYSKPRSSRESAESEAGGHGKGATHASHAPLVEPINETEGVQ